MLCLFPRRTPVLYLIEGGAIRRHSVLDAADDPFDAAARILGAPPVYYRGCIVLRDGEPVPLRLVDLEDVPNGRFVERLVYFAPGIDRPLNEAATAALALKLMRRGVERRAAIERSLVHGPAIVVHPSSKTNRMNWYDQFMQ